MPNVRVSIADVSEHSALNQAYLNWGYHGGILDTDVVHVARVEGRPVDIVRRAEESGVTMLRGMYLAPDFRRQGIGTRLLRAFVADLPQDFLRERLRVYRAEGHKVILMRRKGRVSSP